MLHVDISGNSSISSLDREVKGVDLSVFLMSFSYMMVIEYKVISSSFILAIVLRIELTPNGQLNFIEFMINVIMHRTSKGLKVELWGSTYI